VRAHAQWQSNSGPATVSMGAVVGSDVERYVRALSLAGLVAPLPWSARPFSPNDMVALLRDSASGDHPWRRTMQATLRRRVSAAGVGYGSANSAFAWGANDGPMWQGRGVNGATGLSGVVRTRMATIVLAPSAFIAQNASYPILRPPVVGVSPFSDPQYPVEIDLPQRMGSTAYRRAQLGESTIRLEALGVSAGFSTASVGWGTGEAFPAILGANAGGFPHVTVGTTGRGVRIPAIGRFAGQYVLGVLDQSPWSNVSGSTTFIDAAQPGTRRIGVGATASFMPSLLPGLELGASRFYHSPYRAGASRWDAWSRPFEDIFKKSLDGRTATAGDPSGNADNQLGSVFARWVLPRRGLEANFELLREDHNWDSRDFAQQPENNSAVLGAIRFTTERKPSRLSVVTLEYFDGDVRPIAQVRAQGFLYVHGNLLQGHTLRGQLLGSPVGVGGIAGQRAAWERFTPEGSTRFNLQRWRSRSKRTEDFEGLYRAPNTPVPLANSHDWIIDASVARMRIRARTVYTTEVGIASAQRWNFGAARTNFYARFTAALF
jgi:hypothetical protein